MGYFHLWICGLVLASCALHSFSALVPLFLILIARNRILWWTGESVHATIPFFFSSFSSFSFFFFFISLSICSFHFHFFLFFTFSFITLCTPTSKIALYRKRLIIWHVNPSAKYYAYQRWEPFHSKARLPDKPLFLVLRSVASVDNLRVSNQSNLNLWGSVRYILFYVLPWPSIGHPCQISVICGLFLWGINPVIVVKGLGSNQSISISSSYY